VIQGGASITLDNEAQAVRFNASLPCSGEIVRLEEEGDTVTATFLLGHRETSRCDGPGAEVTAAFRVRDGKIVLWHQLPTDRGSPGAAI
jgi:hypothetical protein